MTQQDLEWVFVNAVPMLFDKKNIERQKKVETWLDLYQVTRELGITTESGHPKLNEPINYVI